LTKEVIAKHLTKKARMSAPKECMICYREEKEWNGSAKTKCGHEMCMECYLRQTGQGGSCPMCRGALPSFPLHEVEPIIIYQQVERAERNQREVRQAAHRQQLRESQMRRYGYLTARQQQMAAHCATCKDSECAKTHERKTNWLSKGHLVPCPPTLKAEGKMMIGYLLCTYRHNKKKKELSERLFPRGAPSDKEFSMRQNGLMMAIWGQKAAASEAKNVRLVAKGSVVKRLGCSLGDYKKGVLGDQPTEGCKTFKGFLPPKKGSRTGDFWVKDGDRDCDRYTCIGYHLWLNPNGTKLSLQKGKWVSC